MDGCHQLVFAANGSCVDTTIIDGRIVFEDRQFTTVDEQKILREANAAFRRVVDRMVVSPRLTPLRGREWGEAKIRRHGRAPFTAFLRHFRHGT